MARLASLPSFSSLYSFASSPRRPSSPISTCSELPAYRSDDRLAQHDAEAEEHATPRAVMQSFSTSPPSRGLALASAAQVHLTADCSACGAPVVMRMPSWLTTVHRRQYEEAMWEVQQAREQACCEQHGVVSASRRDKVVAGAVGAAKAFRDSPLPGILLLIFKTILALCVYLDQQFALRERFVRLFWSLIADLQYVEKETGLMRHSGEAIGDGLSVLWEAFVKGAIALANPDVPVRQANLDRRTSVNPRGRAPPPTPFGEHDHHSFPFASSAAAYDFPPLHSYPSSPPTQHQTSAFLQQRFAYQPRASGPQTPEDSDGEHDYEEAGDYLSHSSSSSAQTAMPGLPIPAPAKRTLRRMANSVPLFHLGGSSSPATAGEKSVDPNIYASGMERPKMARQRSRSGPDEVSSADKVSTARLQVPIGGQGRGGWVTQTITGVVGRIV